MNSIITLLTSIFISFTNPADIPYLTIEKAMIANDSKAIIYFGKETILLNILGKEGAYNNSQAEIILGVFFTKKPKGSFIFIYKGKETNDGTFGIGMYTYNKEKFRVTFHFRDVYNSSKLESLKIEKL